MNEYRNTGRKKILKTSELKKIIGGAKPKDPPEQPPPIPVKGTER